MRLAGDDLVRMLSLWRLWATFFAQAELILTVHLLQRKMTEVWINSSRTSGKACSFVKELVYS